MRPPFRADHVGSLLRPAELKQARTDFKNGKIPREKLKAAEDQAIRKAVALQETAGLQSVTDGEFRRAFWHVDFLTGPLQVPQIEYEKNREALHPRPHLSAHARRAPRGQRRGLSGR